jgi:hypothetical protein
LKRAFLILHKNRLALKISGYFMNRSNHRQYFSAATEWRPPVILRSIILPAIAKYDDALALREGSIFTSHSGYLSKSM